MGAPCECCGVNSSLHSSACGYDVSWHSCGCGNCDMDQAFNEPASRARAGALASVVCSAIALLVMLVFPKLRKHPNNYLALKCAADIIFSAVQLCHWANLESDDGALFSSNSRPPVPSFPAAQNISSYNAVFSKYSITYQGWKKIVDSGFTWHGCSR